jgi:hypothetical protein
MSIRRFVLALLCAVALGVSTTAFAQEADAVVPPVAATTGKFVFTFTVTVSSAVPKNGVVVCTAFATVNESGQNIQQHAVGIVTPSAGKATCIVNMPYSWALATASTDKVALSYKVEVDYGYEFTAFNGTGTSVQLASTNQVNENLATIPVPKEGATTDEAVSATI